LRRLEGENSYPNTTLDEKGAEWRKFTNELAINIDGIPVQNIIKQYETFRPATGNYEIEKGITQEIEKARDNYINSTYP
jgi:hypothetical protein